MTDEMPRKLAVKGPGDDSPIVMLPATCERHRREMLDSLGATTLLYVHLVTFDLLMFRRFTVQPETIATHAGDMGKLNAALQHIGCLACALPEYKEDAIRVMRRGLSSASQVAQGKEDFPSLSS